MSGLCVRDGELQRRNDEGVIIARHQLARLNDATVQRRLDPMALLFVSASVVLAITCQILIPHETWSWVVFSAFMFIGLICFFGITKSTITITSNEGSAHYEATDPAPDVEGFVLSLRSIIHTDESV